MKSLRKKKRIVSVGLVKSNYHLKFEIKLRYVIIHYYYTK